MDKGKKNCWEFMKCERGPGGKKVDEKGICPAFSETLNDGMNGGKNAGRSCWKVAGTLCSGKVDGVFARKFLSCLKCPFLKQVQEEEGDHFQFISPSKKPDFKAIRDKKKIKGQKTIRLKKKGVMS